MGLSVLRRATAVLACSAAVLAGLVTAGGPPSSPRAVPAAASAVAPLRIMPLGASSTVGIGSPATAGYRGPLLDLLAAAGIAVDLVGSQWHAPPSVPDGDHEGHSGWTIDRMQPLVRGWVREERPDVVLLHVGTNDLVQGAGAAVAARRLTALLDELYAAAADVAADARAADVHVVVAGVWAPLARRAQERSDFARQAAAVVRDHRERGRSITYVDTSALLQRAHFTDDLHANAEGYRRIAAMWEREIHAYRAAAPR